MIVRKYLSFRKIVELTWRRMLVVAAAASFVTALHKEAGLDSVCLPAAPGTVLGTAVAILLGFRNNSAYDRWWEARRLWGALVNDSRSVARQALTFCSLKHAANETAAALVSFQRQLVYRQIALAHALCAHLRGQDAPAAAAPFLDDEEVARLRRQKNVPAALLHEQGRQLQQGLERGFVDDFRHVQVDGRLSNLTDTVGGCERIKNTVFPRQYGYFTWLFTWVFILLLPFSLVKDLGYLTIPAALIIGFVFMALEMVGARIENPFENSINDIPMSAIARTIEINLRQQLGEEKLPEPVAPVNGFLY